MYNTALRSNTASCTVSPQRSESALRYGRASAVTSILRRTSAPSSNSTGIVNANGLGNTTTSGQLYKRYTVGSTSYVRKIAKPGSVIVGIFTLASLFALPGLRFDFDPMNLRNPNSESIKTLNDMMAAGSHGP